MVWQLVGQLVYTSILLKISLRFVMKEKLSQPSKNSQNIINMILLNTTDCLKYTFIGYL